ncbi:MAG: ribonuclease HII [bacterium]|nr:ribonuclease HII [bacterium]
MPQKLQSRRPYGRFRGKYQIGIDEVGRGALAGPVLVAAFALPKRHGFGNIRDSKKLTPRAREECLRRLGKDVSVAWAFASSSAKTIDRVNIRRATNRAACLAYLRLTARYPELSAARVILDGGLSLGPRIRHTAYVRGDERFPAIACASIVAKVRRDAIMVRFGECNPAYEFHAHKGYGTVRHRRALRRHGPSEAHRLTFLRNFLR